MSGERGHHHDDQQQQQSPEPVGAVAATWYRLLSASWHTMAHALGLKRLQELLQVRC